MRAFFGQRIIKSKQEDGAAFVKMLLWFFKWKHRDREHNFDSGSEEKRTNICINNSDESGFYFKDEVLIMAQCWGWLLDKSILIILFFLYTQAYQHFNANRCLGVVYIMHTFEDSGMFILWSKKTYFLPFCQTCIIIYQTNSVLTHGYQKRRPNISDFENINNHIISENVRMPNFFLEMV